MDWHTRYLQQASWTHALRQYVYNLVGISESHRVLDVGCGTGVLLEELSIKSVAFGLDINLAHLKLAMRTTAPRNLICADAHQLPFGDNELDMCLCHYVLLWLSNPRLAIMEMQRVTRPEGWVVAFAEPDYLARIDYPAEIEQLGEWQRQSLIRQGANPDIGRKLADLFSDIGLDLIQVGVLGAQWQLPYDPHQAEAEWDVLISDLNDQPDQLSSAMAIRKIEKDAWHSGSRIMFVPTFYAIAKKPHQDML